MRVYADRDPRSVRSRAARSGDHDWIVGAPVARAALIGVSRFFLFEILEGVRELVSEAGHNALYASP